MRSVQTGVSLDDPVAPLYLRFAAVMCDNAGDRLTHLGRAPLDR